MAKTPKMTREERLDAKHVPINFFSLSRFNLPQEFLKKNREYVYSYIAHRCNGEELRDSFHDQMEKGWTPVTLAEYQEQYRFQYKSPLDKDKDAEELIQKGGQYLMKRRKEVHELEKEFWDKRNVAGEKVIKDHIQLNPQVPETIQDYNRKFGRRAKI